MTKIKVQGVEVDPYFIIGVTSDDSNEQIKKAFKRKAKKYHPDKVTGGDLQENNMKFTIVCECFEYIMKKRTDGLRQRRCDIPVKEGTYSDKVQEDATRRYKTRDEYDAFEANAFYSNQFAGKKFSLERFNKMFEWNSRQTLEPKTHKHKETYQALPQETCQALVHSYNGLMIIGDDDQHCHFIQQFGQIRNPTKHLTVPKDFQTETVKSPKQTFDKLLKEKERPQIQIDTSFKEAGDKLFERTFQELTLKEEIDKQLIIKSGVYTQEQIQQALLGDLEASPNLLKAMKSDRSKKKINFH